MTTRGLVVQWVFEPIPGELHATPFQRAYICLTLLQDYSCLGWITAVQRYFEVGYMKKFYTDDYPRASLLCRNRDLSGLDGPRPQGVSMCFPSSQPPDVHAWSDRQHLTPQEDAQENRLTSQTKRINHHNPVCYSKYIDLYRVKR